MSLKTITYRVQKADIMGSYRKRKIYRHEITLEMMKGISLRFVKRLSVPLFHPSHAKQIADIFAEGAEELHRIDRLKNLRQVDKLIQSHWTLSQVNFKLSAMEPNDPRPRGSELGDYTENGWADRNGLDELDEMLTKEENNHETNPKSKAGRYSRRFDGNNHSYYKSKEE